VLGDEHEVCRVSCLSAPDVYGPFPRPEGGGGSRLANTVRVPRKYCIQRQCAWSPVLRRRAEDRSGSVSRKGPPLLAIALREPEPTSGRKPNSKHPLPLGWGLGLARHLIGMEFVLIKWPWPPAHGDAWRRMATLFDAERWGAERRVTQRAEREPCVSPVTMMGLEGAEDAQDAARGSEATRFGYDGCCGNPSVQQGGTGFGDRAELEASRAAPRTHDASAAAEDRTALARGAGTCNTVQ